MKLSFLTRNEPHLVAMIQKDTPDEAINIVKDAIAYGATAFGIQMESMKSEFQTAEHLRNVMTHMGQRPVYLTNYRGANNLGKTDEQLADELVMYAKSGATLIDVIGDAFCVSKDQITDDTEAVKKQKELIARIHDVGCEVLMSSHPLRFMTGEEVLELCLKQKERGADIAKVVAFASTEEEEVENIRTTLLLKQKLGIPFLFLSSGQYSKRHRMLGPAFGGCMSLCVQSHYNGSSKGQPILKAVKAVYDNFDYLPDRIFE